MEQLAAVAATSCRPYLRSSDDLVDVRVRVERVELVAVYCAGESG